MARKENRKPRTVVFHHEPEARTIEGLVGNAMGFADYWLRMEGEVPLTLVGVCPRGLFTHNVEHVPTEEDKEQFALESRLLLVATEAEACAVITEAWMTLLPGIKLPALRSSEPSGNIEVVTVAYESRAERTFLFFPIERTALGVYAALGENAAPEGMTAEGRFSNLLPPKPPTAPQIHSAELALAKAGVRIAKLESDPKEN